MLYPRSFKVCTIATNNTLQQNTFTTMPVSLYDGVPLRNTEQETRLLILFPGEDNLINRHLRIATRRGLIGQGPQTFAEGRLCLCIIRC